MSKHEPKDETNIEDLRLDKETVQDLTETEADQVRGGWIRPPITWTCPQPRAGGDH
jgi:hypothetical protein